MIGIGFALVALVCWGFGDFLIQRMSRDFGIWASLFCIVGPGAIVLLPFAWKDMSVMFGASQVWLLTLLGIISLVVALLQFKALERGKISIIEPILSFEMPLTVLIGVLFLSEKLSNLQGILIAFVFGGILLIGYAGDKIHVRHVLEKGVLIALFGTGFMAIVNIMTGMASLRVGPVATIWFVHTFLALACLVYFVVTKSWHQLIGHVRRHPTESILLAILDNGAWLAYAAAVTTIPISLAITISESYIILAILLGVIINREKLLHHQWVGVIITLASVIFLSSISSL